MSPDRPCFGIADGAALRQPNGVRGEWRSTLDVGGHHVEIEACPRAPITLIHFERSGKTNEISHKPVDVRFEGSYIAVHRRAANGVGGLLLHLLTVDGFGPGSPGAGLSVV
jgi:hypothetical protein